MYHFYFSFSFVISLLSFSSGSAGVVVGFEYGLCYFILRVNSTTPRPAILPPHPKKKKKKNSIADSSASSVTFISPSMGKFHITYLSGLILPICPFKSVFG
jgi:hypothetical protein